MGTQHLVRVTADIPRAARDILKRQADAQGAKFSHHVSQILIQHTQIPRTQPPITHSKEK